MSRVTYPPSFGASDGPAYVASDKPFVPAASGPITLVYDSFTEASNTALASHTPDTDVLGTGWTVTGGTWTVTASGDFLALPAAGFPNNEFGYFDADGYAEYIAAAGAYQNGDKLSIAFRYVDDSNRWAVNRQTSSLDIAEVTGGSAFVRATQTGLSGLAAGVKCHVADDGETINAGEAGSNTISYSSSTHGTSRVTGLGTYGTAEQADNFYIIGNTVDPADLP